MRQPADQARFYRVLVNILWYLVSGSSKAGHINMDDWNPLFLRIHGRQVTTLLFPQISLHLCFWVAWYEYRRPADNYFTCSLFNRILRYTELINRNLRFQNVLTFTLALALWKMMIPITGVARRSLNGRRVTVAHVRNMDRRWENRRRRRGRQKMNSDGRIAWPLRILHCYIIALRNWDMGDENLCLVGVLWALWAGRIYRCSELFFCLELRFFITPLPCECDHSAIGMHPAARTLSEIVLSGGWLTVSLISWNATGGFRFSCESRILVQHIPLTSHRSEGLVAMRERSADKSLL